MRTHEWLIQVEPARKRANEILYFEVSSTVSINHFSTDTLFELSIISEEKSAAKIHYWYVRRWRAKAGSKKKFGEPIEYRTFTDSYDIMC